MLCDGLEPRVETRSLAALRNGSSSTKDSRVRLHHRHPRVQSLTRCASCWGQYRNCSGESVSLRSHFFGGFEPRIEASTLAAAR